MRTRDSFDYLKTIFNIVEGCLILCSTNFNIVFQYLVERTAIRYYQFI